MYIFYFVQSDSVSYTQNPDVVLASSASSLTLLFLFVYCPKLQSVHCVLFGLTGLKASKQLELWVAIPPLPPFVVAPTR